MQFRLARRCSHALAALVVGGSVARSPYAATAADEALAEVLFRDGRKLLTDGRVHEACEKLAESQRVAPAGGTLLNVGACHAQEGRSATAFGELSEALAIARRDRRPDRIDRAQRELAAVTPRLDWLTLRVAEAARVDGLALTLDGTALGEAAWATALPVDPGPHVVRATAPGRVAWQRTIAFGAERDAQTIAVPRLTLSTLTPRPRDADVHDESPSPERSPVRGYVAWSALGVGALGLGVGAGYFFAAQRAHDDAESLHAQRDPTAFTRDQDAHDRLHASRVALGVGVAFAAFGGALLLFGGDDSPHDRAVRAVATGPTLGGDLRSFGWSVAGRF